MFHPLSIYSNMLVIFWIPLLDRQMVPLTYYFVIRVMYRTSNLEWYIRTSDQKIARAQFVWSATRFHLCFRWHPRMDEWLRWVKFVNYHKTQKQNKAAFWRRYHKVGWMWLPQTVGKEEEPNIVLGKLEIESFPGMKQKIPTEHR